MSDRDADDLGTAWRDLAEDARRVAKAALEQRNEERAKRIAAEAENEKLLSDNDRLGAWVEDLAEAIIEFCKPLDLSVLDHRPEDQPWPTSMVREFLVGINEMRAMWREKALAHAPRRDALDARSALARNGEPTP